MRISKCSIAALSCLLLLLTVMSGCTTIFQAKDARPSPTDAITEPEGFRIKANAYNGSDITEYTVDNVAQIIDEGAFANCDALLNFYCASRDITIHENAFFGTENVLFHCYLGSTVDMFAREHGYDRVYFDAFSIRCDTLKNGCAGLPITWSLVDVMQGQDIVTQFVYTVYRNDEPIFISEPTTEEKLVYTPNEGGQYSVTVQIENELTTSSLTSEMVSVADRLTMGWFEQDNDNTTTEPIEWRILTVKDGKALILSEKILTRGAYFNPEWIKFKYTYWAKSCIAESSSSNYWGSMPMSPERHYGGLTVDSVPQGWYAERGPEADLFYLHARYWCNEVFYKEHFSEEEQARILLSDLTNPNNPYYGVTGGPESQDYVFFLSYEEMEAYMPSREDRKATHSTYAYNQPIRFIDKDPYYWLRSPGHDRVSAMYVVAKTGILDYAGADVGHDILGYRPAMWITVGG